MLGEGSDRHEEPFVGYERLPADEHKPPAMSCRRSQVRECRHGIGEEHRPKARDDRIEDMLEGADLRVTLGKGRVVEPTPLSVGPGSCEHGSRQVDADRFARCDNAGHGEGGGTAAASNVERMVAGRQGCRAEDDAGERGRACVRIVPGR